MVAVAEGDNIASADLDVGVHHIPGAVAEGDCVATAYGVSGHRVIVAVANDDRVAGAVIGLHCVARAVAKGNYTVRAPKGFPLAFTVSPAPSPRVILS